MHALWTYFLKCWHYYLTPYPDQNSWCDHAISVDADAVQSISGWQNGIEPAMISFMENTTSSKMVDQKWWFYCKRKLEICLCFVSLLFVDFHKTHLNDLYLPKNLRSLDSLQTDTPTACMRMTLQAARALLIYRFSQV